MEDGAKVVAQAPARIQNVPLSWRPTLQSGECLRIGGVMLQARRVRFCSASDSTRNRQNVMPQRLEGGIHGPQPDREEKAAAGVGDRETA
jgi:hypothetical protein